MTSCRRVEPPPIEEQIEALVRGRLYDLRKKYAPHLPQDEGYKQILTFKSSDVVTYLKSHYRLEDLLKTVHDDSDGFYAVRTVEGFTVYYQEREIRMLQRLVTTEEEVWSRYVAYLLDTTGTGLRFD